MKPIETRHGTTLPIGLTEDSEGKWTLVLELIE